MMDPNFVDPFDDMKENKSLTENQKTIYDMSKYDLKVYIRNRLRMLSNYNQNWLTMLIQNCTRDYKNPCLINLNEFDNFPSEAYLEKEE